MATSLPDSTNCEMHVESLHKQINGDLSKTVEEDKMIMFSPLPQRTLRLNRRGFFLSSCDRQGSKESSNKTTPRCSNDGQCTDPGSDQKLQSPISTEKKIIKLNCSEKYSPVSANGLKRNSSDSDSKTKEQDSQEAPPKKKHKAITWP